MTPPRPAERAKPKPERAARAEFERWFNDTAALPELRVLFERAFVAGYVACSMRVDAAFEELLDRGVTSVKP